MPNEPLDPGTEQPTQADAPRAARNAPGPEAGKRLGDFELLREIGRGGMGVVYEARQLSLNRRVALKTLPPGLGLTDTAVRRFEREARAAAKLHHTNIVPVHAIGQEQGCHYYAMELIEGQSLSEILGDLTDGGSNSLLEPPGKQVAEGLPAPPRGEEAATTWSTSLSETSTTGRAWFDTVARLISEVADGLHYAHGKGIIHRDIKPANLMLSAERRLCITDFGLARVTQEPGMTVSGSFLGTPSYMSPEQIAAGRVKLDHRTDVYSLGAVLYEMLTLQRPFPGEAREEILAGIMTRDPKPLRKVSSRVPVDLETICLKALEKDQERRYATAGEMAEDLRQYLHGGLIAARRAGPVRRAVKVVRRHPVVAVSSVALVIILALSGFAWQLLSLQSEEASLRAVSDARFFLSQGDYRKGLETVDAALAGSPGLPEARLLRARLLIKLNRSQEAVEEAEAILENDSEDWEGHLILGLVAKASDWADRAPGLSADEHLRAVEQSAPETAEAFYLRGLLEENDRTALELLDKSLALDPASADALLERCRRHIDLKNFQAALLDGERLAALRPRSAQGRRMIGEVYSHLHDADQALVELNKAIGLDPDDPRTYMNRADIYAGRLGSHQKRLPDLTRAIELDPDYARYHQQRASAYMSLSRHEEAQADAERALELNPELSDAYVALANAYLHLGLVEKAEAVVERHTEQSKNWKDEEALEFALRGVAWLKGRRNDTAGAIAALDQAIELFPDNPGLRSWRADFMKLRGDRAGFETACDELESMEPAELDDLTSRAWGLRFTCERVDAAIVAFSNLIVAAPEWADPYAAREWLYRMENRHEEALADFGRLFDLAPKWAEAYLWRGHTYMEMERYDDALRDIDRFFEMGEEGPGARQNRAEVLVHLGREDEAFEDLDHSVQRLPDKGWVYRARGYVHKVLGRLDEALADADRCAQADPGDVWCYLDRAHYALRGSASCEAASRDVQKAEELLPEDEDWYWSWMADHQVNSLAGICPDQYDADRALELARKGAEMQSLSAWRQGALGWALYRNGRFEEARSAFGRGLERELKPHPHRLFGLAVTLWKLGDRGEARAMYDQAVSRMDATWPNDPDLVVRREEAAELLGLPL